jgi:hypothetical protein
MKKNRIFSLMIASLAIGFTACNSGGDNTSTSDSTTTSTTSTESTTVTSTHNYAARADSFRTNSKAGYYLNPKSGKAYSSINVDTTSGTITDETGQPIRRYVDKRTWWVYDATSGDTIGSARMQHGSLEYRGSNNDWVNYDKRWSEDTTSMSSSDNSSMNNSSSTGDTSGNTGSGTSGSGTNSKVKIKTPEGKVKSTDKGTKVKPKS